ncbi:MAG: 50S ribosomal protein L11 methyltransferase [Alphaproteobacteria bacterium]|nr:50S ribosomal protein L11 methyltransferase [Alphaproteobacteria bacterium]
MTQSGSCWLIKFKPQENINNITSEFFDEYFDVVAVNYTDDGLEEYVGYKDSHFDKNDLEQAAKQFNITLPPHTTEFLESRNWLKENIIKFAPVNVAEFTIYGIHEKNIPDDGRLNLRIYAATAFGSEHQTTKSCLQAISDYNKLPHPQKINILDVGTGSGILSLAAAKLWQNNCQITAVDIDEEAVSVTRQNTIDNHLQQYISVAVSDGYQSDLVKSNTPYDLILANILARPLISMAPDLYQNLKQGGYCILSGFVEDQEEWVISEHTKLGLKLKQIYKLDNWRAALLEKAE